MTKDQARVRDMISWGMRAVSYLNTVSETKFLGTQMLQDACERCIEVVGEAAEVFRRPFASPIPTCHGKN
jgi:uncharacterized protein with HEPN domain